MSFYKDIIKNLLFMLDPEVVHNLVCRMLPFITKFYSRSYYKEKEVFGIKFKNPIGLAAGFDKNAQYYNDLYKLGFGFIEIGTVTPLPQVGNLKPRLWRITNGLINNMGLNNDGMVNICQRLKNRYHSELIIGASIGYNTETKMSDISLDYQKCIDYLSDYVDYFTLNISCPNVSSFQYLAPDMLNKISAVKPLLIKVGPNLTNGQLDNIIDLANSHNFSGFVATNTLPMPIGGTSGCLVREQSTKIIKYLSSNSNKPIIGVGGIFSPEDALEKIDAGASLLQIYTGLIYEGPGLIKKIINKL